MGDVMKLSGINTKLHATLMDGIKAFEVGGWAVI